ncbi:MAG TPA: NAD-dependent epimerase/dehydratase family protein, partial [Frankiaceae bacterium]|nr:NAD-dependent epimerase/dehydratase family protein [Frankiaceae bacterium]
EALAARGDAVTVLARSEGRAAPLARLGVTVVLGTLDDGPALAAALRGADVVFHLAGLTAAATPAEYLRVNADGTRRLLEAAAAAAPAPSRFVYVSTQAVLGPSAAGARLAEDAPCHPLTAYGRSKLAGEEAVRTATGIAWTIVRPAAVYGPRDREFLTMFALARRGLAPVFGSGSQQLSLVYAPDLADAIVRAGTAPAAAGRTYHDAHPEVVTTRDLVRAIGRAVGRRPLVVPVPAAVATPLVAAIGALAAARGRPSVLNRDKMREFLAPAWLLDVAAAERDLGWRAALDVAEGTRRTAEWYRREGWLR